LRFVKSVRKQIAALKVSPERFGIAPEASELDFKLRQMMHGMYRVLYVVEQETVTILAVRHGARRPLRADDIRNPNQ
jgi:plasmid stabilization system protein ParE